jgi:hypothetical protein
MVLITLIVWALAAQPAPIKVSSARDVIEIRKLNGFVTAFSKSERDRMRGRRQPDRDLPMPLSAGRAHLRNGQSSCDDESSHNLS